MARRILGGLTVLLVAAGAVYAVPELRERVSVWLPPALTGQMSKPVAAHDQNPRPMPVKVAVAVEHKVPIYLDGVGTVTARSTVAIKSRIEGQLFEALVREGQTVHKGDILFRLDPRPLQATLAKVQADLAGNKARYDKAVADVKRLSNLSAKGYAPQTQVEDAKTNVNTFAASVRASQADVELAKLNLDYATIRSPIDGRAGSILVTPGNMVEPNDAQPLLVITETKPIYVSFSVPEQYIDQIRARMAATKLSVEVTTQASRTTAAVGQLFFINNQVDVATGTVALMARFANDDERLVPGQFVKARIRLSTLENAVLVPSRAIQVNQTGHYLWVVRPNDTVELRAVEPGPDSGEDTAITAGLAPGERVVTDGQLRLFPDAKVQPSSGDVTDGTAGGPTKPRELSEAVQP